MWYLSGTVAHSFLVQRRALYIRVNWLFAMSWRITEPRTIKTRGHFKCQEREAPSKKYWNMCPFIFDGQSKFIFKLQQHKCLKYPKPNGHTQLSGCLSGHEMRMLTLAVSKGKRSGRHRCGRFPRYSLYNNDSYGHFPLKSHPWRHHSLMINF